MIGTLWDAALALSLGENRENFVKTQTAEVEHALAGHPRRAEVLEGFRAHPRPHEKPGADPEARAVTLWRG